MTTRVRYSVIIPMYNEEQVIHAAYGRLRKVMRATGERLVFPSAKPAAEMVESTSR